MIVSDASSTQCWVAKVVATEILPSTLIVPTLP